MPRNVVFVAPFPTETTMRFVRAVAGLEDVRLLGVLHTLPEGAADRALYHDVVRVTEPLAVADTVAAVEVLRRRYGEPTRIVGVLEAMMVHLASVRERFGVEGTSVHVAELFRDKAKMKDALRAAGLPVARHALVGSAEDARAFAERVGFPMVVKPLAGMGSQSTFRVKSPGELLHALGGMNACPEAPVLAEEMLSGSEHTLETITLGGEPRATSFSRYLPGCLEVLENPWIQWTCILPREVDTPLHARARDLGRLAIRALGLDAGMTHMEWFERPDGSLVIGEIAQRPPGPQLCQMTGLVHDVDIYRAWARATVDGELDRPWQRKYAAGTAFVRSLGRGRVLGVTGVRETLEAVGPWVVEAKLPTPGTPKSDGYEGDGYIVVRHESTAKVEELLRTIVHTIRIHYG
jgi:D-alanine-D-alanine ligase-like ATP-grasp enzyme